jgi:dTMP kinase
MLAKSLSEKHGRTELIRFPERSTTIGNLIDSYLKSASNLNDQSIHLLFSANRWERSSFVEESLNAGTNLVCDRYAYSGVAFTSAKGLDVEWCKNPDRGLPAPDCIIYLDLAIEEAAQRGQFGEERYEKVEFQKTVRDKFFTLQQKDEEQRSIPWYVLDARKSIDELHQEISTIADEIIAQNNASPIKKLWV